MAAVTVLACSALLLALGLAIRKLGFASSNLPVTAEWIDELSIERYRPMGRLLDGGDMEFLRSQPGFTPQLLKKLRRQRYQIFRGYLACLHEDFARVCSAIELLMRQHEQERPGLAAALLRHRLAFAAGMAVLYVRLVLYRWGVGGVDVGGLVRSFDRMRLELLDLLPAAVPMGA